VNKQPRLLDIDEALKLNRKQVRELYKNHVNPSWAKLQSLLDMDINYVKAEGTRVWDEHGNEYLDFVGGFGSLNIGHNHPSVLDALEKVEKSPVMLQTALGKFSSVLAHNLSQLAPGELNNCWFCSSGTEAVEGALKLARIYTGRSSFIYCYDGFHGKTMGALSVTGRKKYQEPFQPLIPGCVPVPFGDAEALEKALQETDAAAFIVEPVQGEGGIITPPEGYFKKVRELCTRYKTLLIFDEIQTGLGRTGTFFACEHEEIVPDVIVMAKSLSGGVIPIGGYITTASIMKGAYGGSLDKGLMLTSTFGGNTRSAAAAVASVNAIVEENLTAQAQEKGEYFLQRLQELKERFDIIKEVRGRGLLIGMEFEQSGGFLNSLTAGTVKKLSSDFLSSLIAAELLKKYHIMVVFTLNNPNVIRLEPPLTVSYEDIDRVVNAFNELFAAHGNFVKFAFQSGKNAISSFFRG